MSFAHEIAYFFFLHPAHWRGVKKDKERQPPPTSPESLCAFSTWLSKFDTVTHSDSPGPVLCCLLSSFLFFFFLQYCCFQHSFETISDEA